MLRFGSAGEYSGAKPLPALCCVSMYSVEGQQSGDEGETWGLNGVQ